MEEDRGFHIPAENNHLYAKDNRAFHVGELGSYFYSSDSFTSKLLQYLKSGTTSRKLDLGLLICPSVHHTGHSRHH
jgi:hypothetical protein